MAGRPHERACQSFQLTLRQRQARRNPIQRAISQERAAVMRSNRVQYPERQVTFVDDGVLASRLLNFLPPRLL